MRLRFNDYKVVRPTDKRGGIRMFWKNTINLVLFTADTNHFLALFHFKNQKKDAMITGMHALSTPAGCS